MSAATRKRPSSPNPERVAQVEAFLAKREPPRERYMAAKLAAGHYSPDKAREVEERLFRRFRARRRTARAIVTKLEAHHRHLVEERDRTRRELRYVAGRWGADQLRRRTAQEPRRPQASG